MSSEKKKKKHRRGKEHKGKRQHPAAAADPKSGLVCSIKYILKVPEVIIVIIDVLVFTSLERFRWYMWT